MQQGAALLAHWSILKCIPENRKNEKEKTSERNRILELSIVTKKGGLALDWRRRCCCCCCFCWRRGSRLHVQTYQRVYKCAVTAVALAVFLALFPGTRMSGSFLSKSTFAWRSQLSWFVNISATCHLIISVQCTYLRCWYDHVHLIVHGQLQSLSLLLCLWSLDPGGHTKCYIHPNYTAHLTFLNPCSTVFSL